MLVVLRHAHRHQRDLVLLIAVHDTQVGSCGQVCPATAHPLEVTVPAVVEFVLIAPAQRGSPARRAACPDGFARRSLRGGVRPGPSSFEGGIEKLPLLRESRCSSSASFSSACSNRSLTSASWVASTEIWAPWRAITSA